MRRRTDFMAIERRTRCGQGDCFDIFLCVDIITTQFARNLLTSPG